MIPGCTHTDAAVCTAESCYWPACVPNAPTQAPPTFARCEKCGHRQRIYTADDLWHWPQHCNERMRVGADQ